MPFVDDSFTDVSGTLLEEHVGELGASWAHPAWATANDPLTILNNRVEKKAGTSVAYYVASGLPLNPNYTIEATFRKLNSTYLESSCGLIGRVDDDGVSMWLLRYHIQFKSWQLWKISNGVWTQIGVSIVDAMNSGETRVVRLVFDSTQSTKVKAFVDGVLLFSSTSEQIAGLNQVGLRVAGPDSGFAVDGITAFDQFATTIEGSFALTEPKDVFFATNAIAITGTIAVSEAPDALAMSGTTSAASLIADSFTDVPAKRLELHTPDIGGAWLQHPAANTASFHIDTTGVRVQKENVPATSLYYNNLVLPSQDYEVECNLVKTSTSMEAGGPGVCARVQPTTNTFYMFRYHAQLQGWELWSFLNGVATQYGATFNDPLTTGNRRNMRMSAVNEGAQCRVKAYVDGVERFNVLMSVANTFSMGNAGLRAFGVTAGIVLDDYKVRGLGAPAGNMASVEVQDAAALDTSVYHALIMAAVEPQDIAFFGEVDADIAAIEAPDVAAITAFGIADGDLFSYPDVFALLDVFFTASILLTADIAAVEPQDQFSAQQGFLVIEADLNIAESSEDQAAILVEEIASGSLAAQELPDTTLLKAAMALSVQIGVIEPRDKAFITNWKPGDGDQITQLIGLDLSTQSLTGFGGGFRI